MQFQKIALFFAVICICSTYGITHVDFAAKQLECYVEAQNDCGLNDVECQFELAGYTTCVALNYSIFVNEDLSLAEIVDIEHDTIQYAKASVKCGTELNHSETQRYSRCVCEGAGADCGSSILAVFAVLSVLALLL